jgi:hypothetical protein
MERKDPKMRTETIEKINKELNKYGYMIVTIDEIEELKNMAQSLLDAIKVMENKEENK